MLIVENVQAYYGTAHILDGTNLTVGDGEVLGLLGRNGMGKTTLVRSIAGIDPPQQTGGTITYEGEDITNLESFEVARRGIGYVPQGRHVFGSLTVIENLDVIARPPRDGSNDAWNIDRVFSFFPRLEERKTSLARTLSGRRAADVGDRASPDDQPHHVVDGRAIRGPGADHSRHHP